MGICLVTSMLQPGISQVAPCTWNIKWKFSLNWKAQEWNYFDTRWDELGWAINVHSGNYFQFVLHVPGEDTVPETGIKLKLQVLKSTGTNHEFCWFHFTNTHFWMDTKASSKSELATLNPFLGNKSFRALRREVLRTISTTTQKVWIVLVQIDLSCPTWKRQFSHFFLIRSELKGISEKTPDQEARKRKNDRSGTHIGNK